MSFPLWRFAAAATKVYGACVLTACVLLLLSLFEKKIRATPIKTTVRRTLIVLILLAGLAASYFLLLGGMRLFTLLALGAAVILCALVSNLLQDNEIKNLR